MRKPRRLLCTLVRPKHRTRVTEPFCLSCTARCDFAGCLGVVTLARAQPHALRCVFRRAAAAWVVGRGPGRAEAGGTQTVSRVVRNRWPGAQTSATSGAAGLGVCPGGAFAAPGPGSWGIQPRLCDSFALRSAVPSLPPSRQNTGGSAPVLPRSPASARAAAGRAPGGRTGWGVPDRQSQSWVSSGWAAGQRGHQDVRAPSSPGPRSVLGLKATGQVSCEIPMGTGCRGASAAQDRLCLPKCVSSSVC